MKAATVTIALCLLVCLVSADSYKVNSPSRSKRQLEEATRQKRQGTPLMPYRYGYAVQDDIGNDFNQQEESDGFQVTGQYSVVLPDGRIQTVQYSVSPDTGYVTNVAYEGGFAPVVIQNGGPLGR